MEACAQTKLDMEGFGSAVGQKFKAAYLRTTIEVVKFAPRVAGTIVGAVGAVVTPASAGPMQAIINGV